MGFLQFTLGNVSTVELDILHNDEILKLEVSNVTYKVAKVLLRDQYQFKIFNEYVKDRRLEKSLFDLYMSMSIDLDPTNDYSVEDLKRYIHKILDIMNVHDIESYLIDIGMTPPTTLADEFDMNDEIDQKKTRKQTYVKPEFFGLMAVVMVSKALIPVRAITKDKFMVISLLTMMMDHPFFESRQMMRLVEYIDAHIGQAAKTEDVKNRRVLNSGIASDDLTDYVLAIEIFNKFPIALITLHYPPSGNIVASIFKYATGVVTGQEKLTDAVRQKQNFRDENGDDESESVAEGYRQSTRLPIGSLAEFKMVTKDPYLLASSMGVMDLKLLEDILKYGEEMRAPIYEINKASIMLMFVVAHKIIDCRTSESLYRDGMVNLLCVSATYLIENGFKEIAKYLLVKPKTTLDFTISNINSKMQLGSHMGDKIKEKYPMYSTAKLKNKEVLTYSIEKPVEKIITFLENGDYKYILPEEYTGSTIEDVVLPTNIRIIIVEYLLNIK